VSSTAGGRPVTATYSMIGAWLGEGDDDDDGGWNGAGFVGSGGGCGCSAGVPSSDCERGDSAGGGSSSTGSAGTSVCLSGDQT